MRVTNADFYRASTMYNNYNAHVGSELGSRDPFSKENRVSSEILCRRAFISTSKFNHSSDMLMEKIKAARKDI